MYDYLQAMTSDILDYIDSEYNIDPEHLRSEYSDYDDFRDQLNDELWTCDSVTGNGSGSYTFSRARAKDYVTDNVELLQDALHEFDEGAASVAEHFLSEDWEYFDVTIRCYLLGQAIDKALEELNIYPETFEKVEDEEEEG